MLIAHGDGPWVKVQPYYLATSGYDHEAPDGPPVWIERSKLDGWATANTAAWRQFPLQATGANGPASTVTLTFARAELDALDGRDRAVDDRGQHWWRIEIGTEDGRSARGWVSQTHPNTAWESPWPGRALASWTPRTSL